MTVLFGVNFLSAELRAAHVLKMSAELSAAHFLVCALMLWVYFSGLQSWHARVDVCPVCAGDFFGWIQIQRRSEWIQVGRGGLSFGLQSQQSPKLERYVSLLFGIFDIRFEDTSEEIVKISETFKNKRIESSGTEIFSQNIFWSCQDCPSKNHWFFRGRVPINTQS